MHDPANDNRPARPAAPPIALAAVAITTPIFSLIVSGAALLAALSSHFAIAERAVRR